MLTRRDVLRSSLLAAFAVGGGSLLSGCGSGGSGAAGDVELVSSHVARAVGDPDAIATVVAGLHHLGGGLLGAVGAADPNSNLALSAYSAGVALAMTANGALGTTRAQLLDLFASGSGSGSGTAPSLQALDGGLDALTAYAAGLAGRQERADGSKAEVTLSAANALFGQRGERWKADFLDALARSYGAGLQTVDYHADAAGATKAIDAWTSDHTGGKIPQLIAPGALDGSTRLVLVDALYLKAPWERPFEPSATTTGTFTRTDGRTVRAHLMHATGDDAPTLLGRGDGWAATRLPYAGGKLAMTVVLPDAGRFDDVWRDVTAGGLPAYLGSLSDAEVELTLPRWTFRTTASLIPALRSLGVTDAFGSDADFSVMTDSEALQISEVVQQVYVAVDEGGTEAAAATAVAMATSAARAPSTPYRFVADRPFVFAIHDVAHGTPLFVGRVLDPTA